MKETISQALTRTSTSLNSQGQHDTYGTAEANRREKERQNKAQLYRDVETLKLTLLKHASKLE